MNPYNPVLVTDWGDDEHEFRLKVAQILELENVCGIGIYAIARRLVERQWHFNDVRETVRLGLIGGGLTPKAALALVRTYIDERPLSESYGIALRILERVLDPPDEVKKNSKPADESDRSKSASAGPSSTEPAAP